MLLPAQAPNFTIGRSDLDNRVNHDNSALQWRHILGGALVCVGIVGAMALMPSSPKPFPEAQFAEAQAEECATADAAAVAELKPVMDRTDGRSSTIFAANFRLIAEARRACARGDTARAIELYGITAQAFRSDPSGSFGYGD